MNSELVGLLQFIDTDIMRSNLRDYEIKDRLRTKVRAICPHKYPNGESAWVDGMDSQCAICHSRD